MLTSSYLFFVHICPYETFNEQTIKLKHQTLTLQLSLRFRALVTVLDCLGFRVRIRRLGGVMRKVATCIGTLIQILALLSKSHDPPNP